jgi:dTDP-4-dehydrorhamnose 3,5-epimerase
MKFIKTEIDGLWIIEPEVHGDSRGYFVETYKAAEFERAIGKIDFVQDNESCSCKGVLRGLHYQIEPYWQSKLVRVITGAVLDVAVDIRVGSPTYGCYKSVVLSGDNKRQLFIPRGFAHGFYVLSDTAVFTYKVDNIYMPAAERSIRYDDATIGIDWHIPPDTPAIVSDKDRAAPLLHDT